MEGLLYLENNQATGVFTQERVQVLHMLASQAAISLENAEYYQASNRFVPNEFLHQLGRRNLTEVQCGDQIQLPLSVMFCDIRDFTPFSEKLTPEKLSVFLNRYLQFVAPIIRQHQGFVLQFMGDGFLALFPQHSSDAITAGWAIQAGFAEFNQASIALGYGAIEAGIGINYGTAMLSVIGESQRYDATVVGDVINSASRVEELNKHYGSDFLITGDV